MRARKGAFTICLNQRGENRGLDLSEIHSIATLKGHVVACHLLSEKIEYCRFHSSISVGIKEFQRGLQQNRLGTDASPYKLALLN